MYVLLFIYCFYLFSMYICYVLFIKYSILNNTAEQVLQITVDLFRSFFNYFLKNNGH